MQTPESMKILVVVTHLLGTGHLRRAINLSSAFVANSHKVHLASGGLPVDTFDTDGIALVQLSPLQSDGTNFTRLLKADGTVADDAWLADREDQLKTLLEELQPDIIITELFPFGRRVLRREFCSLLEVAQSLAKPPVILSSVRDILAPPSSEKKVQKTEELINKYYDGVLVHSDRDTTPLSVSWPVTDLIDSKLFYTGYVAQALSNSTDGKPDLAEVVVSAGGGSVGKRVYEIAIETARLSQSYQWRILVGGQDSDAEVRRLKKLAQGTTAIIEPNRPDFRALLTRAVCSVSMCGYNTAIDLLLTGTPGVLIPFDAGGEQEQTLRASSLAARSAYVSLLDKHLTPESLALAVEQVASSGRFTANVKQFNGALESVRVATMLAKRKNNCR